MNLAIFESSLFRLTQDLDEPLCSVAIGAETLKSHVSSIIELLIEQQLRATIWVKPPQTKSWLSQIHKLQQEGNVENIFLYGSKKHYPNLSFADQNNDKTPIITLRFRKSSILQKESFLIVIAEDFCCLILAQWQKGKITIESYGKRLQQPYLETVFSFDAQEILPILSSIRDQIDSSGLGDHHVEMSFELDREFRTSSKLIGQLVAKQMQASEKLHQKLNTLPKTYQNPEKSDSVVELQEDFLNNLVQELRSPITHMKTALSLLESKQIKGEQRQRYLQMVSDECDRQNSLVGGLLELLQLDTPAEAEQISLNEVVPGIVSTYQPLAEEKQIQLGYTIPANIPPIACPRPWFRQIIINLLNNSLQFTPAQGKVAVQAITKQDREYVEISVQDTGVGIPSSEINKIFQGFYRTKPNSRKTTTGAGLGLTIVEQLVKRCGGSISVTSKLGKGTTFKLLIPAVPPELIENN